MNHWRFQFDRDALFIFLRERFQYFRYRNGKFAELFCTRSLVVDVHHSRNFDENFGGRTTSGNLELAFFATLENFRNRFGKIFVGLVGRDFMFASFGGLFVHRLCFRSSGRKY